MAKNHTGQYFRPTEDRAIARVEKSPKPAPAPKPAGKPASK